MVWHFFVHWTGGDYGAPRYGQLEPYDWLSGILGLSFLGLFYSHLRKSNCHVRYCWRIGRFPAGEFQVCRRHNPDGAAPTAETVRHRHHLYLGKQPGKG